MWYTVSIEQIFGTEAAQFHLRTALCSSDEPKAEGQNHDADD